MNRNHTVPRRGFTLVELLVVLAVIGVLVSLLLPAVQSAREAVRRTSCANNLKQLALGLHNYESAFRVLPSGYLHRFGPPGTSFEMANHMGLAWGAAMLPQLEQGGVYERINFQLPMWDPRNQLPRETHLSVFLCPSDTYSDSYYVVRDQASDPVERYAAASYAANWGPADEETNLDATPLASRGVFFRNSRIRIVGILGGLSNTLAFGERTNGPIPSTQPTAGGHSRFENVWSAAVRDIDEPSDDHAHMVLFETQFLPNELNGDDKGLSAPHGGLCQFALCDGSVRAVSTDIDRDVYNAMASRDID